MVTAVNYFRNIIIKKFVLKKIIDMYNTFFLIQLIKRFFKIINFLF